MEYLFPKALLSLDMLPVPQCGVMLHSNEHHGISEHNILGRSREFARHQAFLREDAASSGLTLATAYSFVVPVQKDAISVLHSLFVPDEVVGPLV